MKFKHWFKKWTAIVLVLSVLLSLIVPAGAVEENSGISYELVDSSRVSATLLKPPANDMYAIDTATYDAEEIVRVSIVLEKQATIDRGYEVYGIAENSEAMNYRQSLVETQSAVIHSIEETLGSKLNVKWQLTLAANIISAEVEYWQIETIENIEGVESVVIEAQYSPMDIADSDNTASPHMVISTGMTGSAVAWTEGYTGAGTRIAIIDTGIDTDHQSFSEAGFLYALEKNAEVMEMDLGDYKESLNLLDADEVQEKLWQLNVRGKSAGATGENLYKSEKIPFAFNYVDQDYEYVTHDQDTQSDHGSHVAGIAAANRYVPKDGGYIDALEELYVTGNAPDAQLLVMKVFGMNGGAYDSDYMAAIEDAIMLGADTINLSLGTQFAGYSNAGIYQYVMDSLTSHGAVVAMAAGNSDAWPNYSNTAKYLDKGLLYTDDVYYDTMGSPASYTNSLAVASVNNQGQIMSGFLAFTNNERTFNVGYSETLYNSMKSIVSLDKAVSGGTEFPFVIIEGLGSPEDYDGIDVEGKIAFVKRGELAFYEKAKTAVDKGAIATVVYNNVEGTIGMDLTDYPYTDPAVAITKADAETVMAEFAEKHTTDDGKVYYTGTLRIRGDVVKDEHYADYYSMSDFSSWGTTGDLALKPEISAPGGNIYSVKGDTAATDTYKINSGTSMASPQVAGIGAVVAQYIKENLLIEPVAPNTKYLDKFGHTARQINQSLLMSSAIPMKDENGAYFPILRQGSGLANSNAAINADAYIMMEKNATQSWADGKVKAELGDDPRRSGVYEFSFNIYNLSDTEAKTYTLSADVFTQDVLDAKSAPDSKFNAYYMLESTKLLDTTAEFKDAAGNTLTDGKIVVPAGGYAKVTARMSITDAGKSWLGEYYKKGTYIQGFVFADPTGNAEGVKASTLSIPMLAFYGNWTDPSMYDAPSYKNGEIASIYSTENTTDHSRVPYQIQYGADVFGYDEVQYGKNYIMLDTEFSPYPYAYGGNPLVEDENYHPERNAVNGSVYVEQWEYVAMRASSSLYAEVRNLTTGQIYAQRDEPDYEERGIWYSKTSAAWQGGQSMVFLNWQLPNVPEGETIRFSMMRLPEYYNEGKMGEKSAPGEGARLYIDAVIDSTCPQVMNLEYTGSGFDVTASDENYIAGVVLYSGDGKEVLAYTGSKETIEKGESAEYEIECSDLDDANYLLQVFDYAMNAATYYIEIENAEVSYEGAMLAFDLDKNGWVQVDKTADKVPAVSGETRTYTAASAVMEKIYAIAYGTELYCLNVAQPDTSTFIGDTGVTIVDLCYNPYDGYLYGVTDKNKLAQVNTQTGKGIIVGTLPLETNTIACDENGVFYSNLYGTGKIYSYTIDSVKAGDTTYDFDGTGAINDGDVQAVLDYVNGKRASIENMANADIDGDSDVDSYDAYLLLDKLPKRMTLVADTCINSRYMQAMEIDPNDGTLYWASYCTELIKGEEVGFSYIYEIDTYTGEYVRHYDLWDQLCALVVLDKDCGNMYGPVNGTEFIDLGEAATAGYGSAAAIMSAEETAAIASESGVNNDIKNETAVQPKTVEVELTAGSDAANGIYTVVFDPAVLTLVSNASDAEFTSIDSRNGLIAFGYVGKNVYEAGETVATLTFETISCEADAEITLKQENNSRPNSKTVIDSGAHTWGEWSEAKAATCVADGEEIRICSVCEAEGRRSISADEKLHGWSDWNTALEPAGNGCGIEERTCAHCGITTARWTVSKSLFTSEQTTQSGRVDMYRDAVEYAEVLNAGLEKVTAITTTDGSLRYIAELSALTDLDATVDVYIQPGSYTASGFGDAIKREKVESVGWDADDTDYTITLEKGIGTLTAYSYYNNTQYTEIKIYFVVGETGTLTGQRSSAALPEMSIGIFGGFIRGIDIRETQVLKVYNITNEAGTEIESHIWLTGDTPADAELPISIVTAGRVASLVNTETGENYATTNVVKLKNGSAKLCLTFADGGGVTRNYVIYLRNYVNLPPKLLVNANESKRVQINAPFTLDLSKVFIDLNDDVLSYTVSVNGAEAVAAAEQYSITPTEAGEMVLVFTASDTFMPGEEKYTLTLNVSETAYIAGDVNSDGAVDTKDVTVLKRYIANWPNITINLDAADVKADGIVDAKDVTVLKRYLAKWPGITLG